MPEHYPRNVKSISSWCSTCRRVTQHRVDDRRRGTCLEHNREGLSKAQQKRREEMERKKQQPELF